MVRFLATKMALDMVSLQRVPAPNPMAREDLAPGWQHPTAVRLGFKTPVLKGAAWGKVQEAGYYTRDWLELSFLTAIMNTRKIRSLSKPFICAITRTASTGSGTRCGCRILARKAGMVQTSLSTSPHLASRTSPDRQAVRMMNCNALADVLSRAVSSA